VAGGDGVIASAGTSPCGSRGALPSLTAHSCLPHEYGHRAFWRWGGVRHALSWLGAGSDDRGGAGLVDAWLQARNALSIEIFRGTPHPGSSLPLPRLKASPTASSGAIEHSAASVRHLVLVEAGE